MKLLRVLCLILFTPESEGEGEGDSPKTIADKIMEKVNADDKPQGEQENIDAFTPDFNYKVHDEVKQFDQRFQTVIKDKETEDMLRELYEKSGGLDKVKTRRDELQEKLRSAEDQVAQTTQTFNDINELGQKDLNSFFQVHKIPEDKILQYALDRAKRNQLPAEEQRYFQEQDQVKQNNYLLEQQNRQMKQSQDNFLAQQADFELNTALNIPDIKQYSDKIPGFRDQVMRYGANVENTTKKSISAEQACRDVLNNYMQFAGINQGQQPQPAGTQAPQAPLGAPLPVQPQTGAQQPAPTIPNLGTGGGQSPARQRFKSLDELKKFTRERIKSLNGD